MLKDIGGVAGPVDHHLLLDLRLWDQLMHPVQAADEDGLATPRRAYDRRHLVLGEGEADVVEGLLLAIPSVKAYGLHLC
jgi:hypothetical protein